MGDAPTRRTGLSSTKIVDILIADWLDWLLVNGTTIGLAIACIGTFVRMPHIFTDLPWYAWAYLPLAALCLVGAIWLSASVLIIGLLLQSTYEATERRNGGPFRLGDRVMILTGRHYGHVATVTQQYQFGLPMVAGPDGTLRIYNRHQLRRIADRD